MELRAQQLCAVAFATAMAASAAQAETVSIATVTVASGNGPGSTVVDFDTQTTPNGMAQASIPGSSATQNADGTSGVVAEISNPFGGTQRATAVAEFQQTETNDFGEDRLYSLDFELSGLSTLISTSRQYGSDLTNPFADDDPSVLDFDSAYTAASFEYAIAVNGANVYTARADVLGLATFTPSFDLVQEFSFDNVENFTPTLTLDDDPDFNGNDQFIFAVDDLTGTIDLGIFGTGALLEVTSTLTARAFATTFEAENAVGTRSFDPIQISSIGFTSRAVTAEPPVVPLPAAGWMLLAGLGGLGAMRRFRNAS